MKFASWTQLLVIVSIWKDFLFQLSYKHKHFPQKQLQTFTVYYCNLLTQLYYWTVPFSLTYTLLKIKFCLTWTVRWTHTKGQCECLQATSLHSFCPLLVTIKSCQVYQAGHCELIFVVIRAVISFITSVCHMASNIHPS